jgi:co-chaperonin GroES (HSP10)
VSEHVFDSIRAFGDFTIAEMQKPPEASKGGILIPETAQRADPWWKVISVGPKQNDLKPGERVLFVSGAKVEHDGRVIVALKPSEVVGTLPAPVSHDWRYPTRY